MAAYSRAEWNSLIQQTIDLGAECDLILELELVEPNHVWAKSDIREVRDALILICSDNASESQGGTGDDSAPFNDEFAEKLDAKIWHQKFVDAIEAAIANGCCSECCWEMGVFASIDFPGNTIDQPVFFTWTLPGECGEENESAMRAAIIASINAAAAQYVANTGLLPEYAATIEFAEDYLTYITEYGGTCGDNTFPIIHES